MNNRQVNLQDAFLNAARKRRIPVTIFVTNGYQINNAIILSYDSYVVLTECDGREMLIFKHAISTISPAQKLGINTKGEE